jgi:hypothetical protein
MNRLVETLAHLGQDGQPSLAICIVQVNVFAPVTARSDVVQGVGEFNA